MSDAVRVCADQQQIGRQDSMAAVNDSGTNRHAFARYNRFRIDQRLTSESAIADSFLASQACGARAILQPTAETPPLPIQASSLAAAGLPASFMIERKLRINPIPAVVR